ncbi:VOC family protein [Phaeobacter piscinae]|nr:VOC family protein [Phaeobacter piscinae]
MKNLRNLCLGIAMVTTSAAGLQAETKLPNMAVELVTLHTDNYSEMLVFYRDVLKLEVAFEQGEFANFVSTPTNLGLVSRSGMLETLGDSGFDGTRTGSGVGLGFYFDTDAQVDEAYAEIVDRGARVVSEPTKMPWGEYIGFFSDPDGNVHEFVSREKH